MLAPGIGASGRGVRVISKHFPAVNEEQLSAPFFSAPVHLDVSRDTPVHLDV